MGDVAARALAPLGYTVSIEAEASMGRCPGLVSNGTVHLGANQTMSTRWAYLGTMANATGSAMPALRTLATIMMPAWFGIAVRWETGITDLAQIKERQYPLRVLGGSREVFASVFAY